jgi:hypothetical protein
MQSSRVDALMCWSGVERSRFAASARTAVSSGVKSTRASASAQNHSTLLGTLLQSTITGGQCHMYLNLLVAWLHLLSSGIHIFTSTASLLSSIEAFVQSGPDYSIFPASTSR